MDEITTEYFSMGKNVPPARSFFISNHDGKTHHKFSEKSLTFQRQV